MMSQSLLAVFGPVMALAQPPHDAGAVAAIAGLLILIAGKAGIVAMAVWIVANKPAMIERIAVNYETRCRRCVIIGAANIIGGCLLAVALINTGILAFVGIAIILLLLWLLVTGMAAFYGRLGARLAPESGAARRIVFGGLTAELAFLVPILGQLIAIGVVVRAVGAAAMVLLIRNKTVVEKPPGAEDENAS